MLQLFVVDEGEASVVAPNIFFDNQPILNEVAVGIGIDAESEEADNNDLFLVIMIVKSWNFLETKRVEKSMTSLTLKKVKRFVLEKLEGSYIDEFNKLEAYAKEPGESNPVVDKETSRTWKWLAELLRSSLDLADGEGLTFMSDIQKKCTCRTWDLKGIPCPHSIKAYIHDKQEPEDHVNWWYSKESYMLVYMYKIQPVRGSKFWKVDSAHAMEPPKIHKMAGRPKLKRKREKTESRKGEGVCQEPGVVMPTLDCVAPLCEVADTDGDESEEDEQLTIQPKRISEAKTRLEAKKVTHRPTGTRKIDFKGDENGVSIPTNLPY
ncbi:hypothetical protein FXO38_15204 [Capsicum annuum]|nr:hypothetical protein FXO38_15204 [Capsicum annuum]